jgi:tetratricopeptide (TPR) repeat protein
MSVLFKALQKAEKENEQRQTLTAGPGFDAERLAGSGAIKSGRGRGGKMRWAAIAGTVVLAVGIIGGVLFLSPQEPPHPQVAALMPPPAPPRPVIPPAAPQTAAPQAAAIQPAVPQDAAPVAAAGPASEPAAANSAPIQPATSEPVKTAEALPVPAQAAVVAAPAPAAQAIQPPAAVQPAETAASLKETVIAQAPASPPAAKPPVAAPAVPKEKPAAIPANSPALALNPPIAIARSDFALSGVGNAVQVRNVSQESQNNVSSGYNALLRGEYDTALGFYDQALQKEPASVLALLGRGAALQKLRRFEDAQASYDKVLKLDPANREALTNVTTIVGERTPGEALGRLLDLEKTYPEFSPIKAQIGLIYAKSGNMESALDYMRHATAMAPESAMYRYNLALVLDHMGQREQAIAAYQDVLGAIALGRAPPEMSSTEIERRLRYLRVK